MTGAGTMQTKRNVNMKFKLDEFSQSKEVKWNFHVDESNMSKRSLEYDAIIGLDIMCELGLIINCKTKVVEWDGTKIPMSSKITQLNRKQLRALLLSTREESESTKHKHKRLVGISDNKYEAANLDKLEANTEILNANQRKKLLVLLHKYEDIFDSTLGYSDTPPVRLDLKEGVQLVHSRSFPVSHVHKEPFLKEIQRMVAFGVLKKYSDSPWALPTFIIPKPNKTVRMVSDFRKVNSKLVRKYFPIPKIIGIMQELEGFKWALTLDLNMGYYIIRLDLCSQDICIIITPWGRYKYLRLPSGIMCAPDIF